MCNPTNTELSLQEYLACTHLSTEWAHSYDTKDWGRLSTILLPVLHINYTSVMGAAHDFPSITATDYVAMMSNPAQLGNPLVGTQHHLGSASFVRTEDGGILGVWQLRAHHVRFGPGERRTRGKEVIARATGHAVIKHFYQRNEEGEWKLAGLEPRVLFDEGDLKALFDMQ